jgi:hypothetical protein
MEVQALRTSAGEIERFQKVREQRRFKMTTGALVPDRGCGNPLSSIISRGKYAGGV